MNIDNQTIATVGAIASVAFSVGSVLMALRSSTKELGEKIDSVRELLAKDINNLDRRLTAIESIVIYKEIKGKKDE